MQNYKKFLLAAAATLVFSANALAVDKYKVGIEGAYPPFNNKNESGQVVGFDYAGGHSLIEHRISKRTGRQPQRTV